MTVFKNNVLIKYLILQYWMFKNVECRRNPENSGMGTWNTRMFNLRFLMKWAVVKHIKKRK